MLPKCHAITHKRIIMKRLLATLLLAGSAAIVQAEDYGLWTEAGLSQNLGVKGLSAGLGYDMRMNNHLKGVTRHSFNVGLDYSLARHIKVGAAYAYIYSRSNWERVDKSEVDDEGNVKPSTMYDYNYIHSFWRNKHRFIGYVKGDVDLGRFNLSLRERFQHTLSKSADTQKDKYRFMPVYDEDDNLKYELREGYLETETDHKRSKIKDYLRQKVELSYNIRHCPITPDISVEMENDLHNCFHIDEMRYAAGAEWKVTKKIHLGFHYRFHCGSGDDEDSNLHALELSLKLKNPFWKAKK